MENVKSFMENGQKTEIHHYPSSGKIVKRTFDNPWDIIPSDVITLRMGNAGKAPVAEVENREYTLYRHFYNC